VGSSEPAPAAARLLWRFGTARFTRVALSLIIVGAVGANIVACGSGGGGPKLGERVIPLGQPVPKGGGAYRVGEPYQLNGVWYQPTEDTRYDQVGTASWYGEMFHGRRTANGEIYDMERLSAASPTLPMPVYARVTNLANGRSLIVRVNDRGPYRSNRIMDLSRRSAELLGYREQGTARVRVQYLGRAPLNGDDSYERRNLASQPWAQFAMRGKSGGMTGEPATVASVERGAMPSRRTPQRLRPPIVPLVAEDEEWAAPSAAAADPTLKWKVSPRGTARRDPPSRATVQPTAAPITLSGKGVVILAGSFKNKDNADRALTLLGGIAQVEVAPMSIGGETFFRVRVGPFADRGEAGAALERVTEAGYSGARIVMN
jgi:rare lipoprotein A